jgi:hypothetical protein
MSKAPKLNATVPVRFGFIALGCSAVLVGSLFAVDVDQGPVALAAAVKRAEPVVVRHDMVGTLAQMHVSAGMDVAAGALIAQFDRRHIESELAALRKRIDARRMEIDGLKQEAAALAAAGDKTAARTRIAALDAEAIEADRVIVGHSARVALLEGQLERLEIRAPVAGRIVEIVQGNIGSSLAAKAPLAIIRPSMNRLQVDVSWPASAGAVPAAGQTARVWMAGTLGIGGTHVGKVESIGSEALPEGTETRPGNDTRARIALDVSGTPLADLHTNTLTLNVQLVTGSKSLAEHLFAPLMVRRVSDKTSSEGTAR